MTTNEVAEKYGVDRTTVVHWCKRDGTVKRKLGKNGVMEYDLSTSDLKRFENRRGKGWKKGVSRKAK